MMRPIFTIAGLFLLSIFSFRASDIALAQYKNFDNVIYFKQPSEKQQSEKKGEQVEGKLNFDSSAKAIAFTSKDRLLVSIPYQKIRHMLYERASRPRYVSGILVAWPLLLTKGKKHFLTVQYTDDRGQGQYALFRLDKKNFRDILATAEAESGTKVDRMGER